MKTVYFINSSGIGHSNESLGRILMASMFKVLAKSEAKPDAIIFLNSGVKLAVDAEKVVSKMEFSQERKHEADELLDINGLGILSVLKNLEAGGVEILSCSTCLNYYQIMDQLAVGKASNMTDIQNILLESDKVVTV